VLKAYLRGQIIAYSSLQKKVCIQKQEKIEREISQLEERHNKHGDGDTNLVHCSERGALICFLLIKQSVLYDLPETNTILMETKQGNFLHCNLKRVQLNDVFPISELCRAKLLLVPKK
jgi:hypothetical protein